MRRYPPAALTMIGVTALIAALLTWDSIRRIGLPPGSFWTFIVLTGFASISLLYPIRSAREQVVYSLANTFVFGAALLLPHSWTALMCIAIWFPTIPQRMKQWKGYYVWLPPLTNAAQYIVVTALVTGLLDGMGAHRLLGVGSVAWTSAAAVLFVVAQTLYVSVLVSLYRQVRWRSLDMLHVDSILSDLVLAFFGVVIAALWTVEPALLVIAGLSLAVVYRMMRGIQLVRQAELDPKTGIYNIRYFEEQLKAEVRRSLSLRRPVSLIFADLDYLRSVNNTFGHQAGDAAIVAIASIFQAHAGKTGIPARFGGEEFVLLLPGADIHEAAYLAERIREAVEQARIPVEGDRVLSITMSLGVASCPDDGTTPESLVKAADEAVYAAKSGGRNRVCVASDGGETNISLEVMEQHVVAGAGEQTGAANEQTSDSPGADALRPKPALPPAAQLVVVGSMLAATGVAAWSFARLHGGTNWIALGIFAVLACLGQTLKVTTQVPDGSKGSLSVTMAVALAAGTYLGLAEAVLVNLISVGMYVWQSPSRDLHRMIFNLCLAALAAAAGALPSELIRYVPGDPQALGYITSFVGAALYYVTNVGLMVLFSCAVNHEPPLVSWRRVAYLTPHFLSLTLAGGFVGRFFPVLGWFGTLALLVLLLLVRRTFQEQVQHMDTALKALQDARDLLFRANRLERNSMRELTEAVSAIIDARDQSVYGHSRQVARYATAIAEEMGIRDPAELDEIRTAALLHDLGKVGVPESILHKPGRLTPEEYEVVKQHAALGERILAEVSTLRRVAAVVGAHHEYWDGHGYPRGIAGETIPLAARIVAVADTLDSILTDRPYSRARSLAAALKELRRCSGTQFEPTVVEALLRLAERWPPHYFKNPMIGPSINPQTVGEAACTLQA